MMGQGITRGCSGGGRMILIAILFVAMLLNWCYCVSLPIVEISLVMGMIYVIANIEILWQISVALRIVAMLIAIIVIAIECRMR